MTLRRNWCAIAAIFVLTAFLITMYPPLATAKGAVDDSMLGLLSAIDIVTKDDLEQPIDEAITRAEFAMLAVRLQNITNAGKGLSKTKFYDVLQGSYEEDYIYAAVNLGVLQPVSENYFHPFYPISMEDATLATLKALGYGDLLDANQSHLALSGQLNLTRGVGGGTQVTREQAYRIIYNALFADVFSGVSYGDNVVYKAMGRNALYVFHGITEVKGKITATEEFEPSYAKSSVGRGGIRIGDEIYFLENQDISMLGQQVTAYYKEDNDKHVIIYMVYNESKSNRITLISEEISSFSEGEYRYYQDGKEQIAKLDMPYVYYNGAEYTGAYLDAVMKPDQGEITLLDSDGDGLYDYVFIDRFEDCLVVAKSNEDLIVYGKFGEVFDFKTGEPEVTYIGPRNSFYDFSQINIDNVLSVRKTLDGMKITVNVSTENIDGAITEAGEDEKGSYFVVNEKPLYLTPELKTALETNQLPKPEFGRDFAFYLNYKGRIAYLDDKASTYISDRGYGIVTKVNFLGSKLSSKLGLRVFSKMHGGFTDLEVADVVTLNGVSTRNHQNVYDALRRDGADGDVQEKPVPQLVTLGVNEDGKLNYILQTGLDDPDYPSLKLHYEGSALPKGSYIPERDSSNSSGLALYDIDFGDPSTRSAVAVFESTRTTVFSVPYENENIAVDYEVAFVARTSTAGTKRRLAYKENPDGIVSDVIIEKASASLGSKYITGIMSSYMVSKISRAIKDDELCTVLNTDIGTYYITDSSGIDINALELYNRDGFLTGKTHALVEGDIVSLTTGPDGFVNRIEALYDSKNDKMLGDGINNSDTVFTDRANHYLRLYRVNVYRIVDGYILGVYCDPDEYDPEIHLIKPSPIPKTIGAYDKKTKTIRTVNANELISYEQSPDNYTRLIIRQGYGSLNGRSFAIARD